MLQLLFPLVLFLSCFIWGCEQGNFKAPMALQTGYVFPGAATLSDGDDGTYILSWPLPPAEGIVFRIYKRTGSEEFDFSKPFKETEEQIYITDDLRFAEKTCFVVRFYIEGYEGDKNTNDVCTKEFDYTFGGLDELTRDEKNVWTLSWKAAPFKKVTYRVYEVDPNGSIIPEPLREVTEAFTRLGPYPIGTLKCFVVRMLIAGNAEGDSNTQMKCTDSNRIGQFVGVEQAESTGTGVVRLSWSAADNESVVGYLVYRGTDFKEFVTRVDLRQTNSIELRNLTPGSTQSFGVRALSLDGSEDSNTRTISVEVQDLRPVLFSGLNSASVSGKGEVLLSWTPVDGVSEYRIYSASGETNSAPAVNYSQPVMTVSDPKTSEIRIQNLGDELDHSFVVRSVSRFNVEDQNLIRKTVSIPDQGAPVFRGVKAAAVVDGKVRLTWEPGLGGVKHYKIYRVKGSASSIDFSQTSLPVEPATSTSAIIGGFQANQFYTFAVRSEDDYGNVDSNSTTVTVLVGQQSLPFFSGYVGTSALGERTLRVSFNVTSDANIKQYRVRTRMKGTTNWIADSVVPQDLTRSTIDVTIGSEDLNSPLRAKSTYDVLVTAVDIWGNESSNTTPYSISTLDLTPPVFNGVVNVEQTPGSSSLKLNWLLRPTNDIDKYVVYWANSPMDGSVLHHAEALPSGVQKTVFIDGAATSHTMNQLQRGPTYYFVVHAIDSLGNEEKNSVQVSAVILNSFPSLLADVSTIRTPEREPGVTVNLTATDINSSDTLSISLASTTCPAEMNLPELTVSPQEGGTRKAQVTWTPSQDFIQSGQTERSCTATYKAFDGEANSPVVLVTLTAYNRSPRDVSATIPSVVGGYKRSQSITCTGNALDDDGNGLIYDYQWIKNGTPIADATSSTLTPAVAAYAPNDAIVCRVGVNDGHIRIEASSAEIVMGNSAPSLNSFSIAEDGGSAPLLVGDRIVCAVSVSDLDGDSVSLGAVSIESSADGVAGWSGETVDQVECGISGKGRLCYNVDPVIRRKYLRCKLDNYTDGFAPMLSPSYSANVIEVKNSTPKINTVSITPTSAFEVGSELTCNADVTDNDGDALQTAPLFQWTRDGLAIEGAQGRQYTVQTSDRSAQLRCEAVLPANADGFGSTAVGPVKSAPRSYANSVPQIQSVQVSPVADAITNSQLTCAISVFDPDGDVVNTAAPSGVFTWLANDGTTDTVIQGQSGNTLNVSQDLRRKTIKCSLGLNANSDGRGAPAVAATLSSNAVLVKNSNPTLTDVSLSASVLPVVTGTVLTCNRTIADLDGDAFNDLPRYKWYADGATISGASQQTFNVRSRDRGKKITCSVELNANFDGQGSSAVPPVVSPNFVTPANSEPVISGVNVSSTSLAPYYPGISLSCDVGSISDPDGDNVEPTYQWYDGSTALEVTTRQYSVTSEDRGRSLKCAALLADNADGWGSTAKTSMSLNSASIQNREPVKNFTPMLQPEGSAMIHRSAAVRCVIPNTVTEFDPDGDPVMVKYIWKKAGSIFPGTPETGTTSDVLSLASDGASAPGQQLSCAVSISDGLLTSTSISSANVTIQNRPPTIVSGSRTQLSPVTLYASSRAGSETLTCTGAQFTDPDGDSLTLSYEFRKQSSGASGSVALATADPTSNTYTADPPNTSWARGDTLWCEVTAVDTYSGSVSMNGQNTTTRTTVSNSAPVASSINCNNGTATLQQFVNENFSTAACTSDFDDGDGEAPVFFMVAAETTCPGIGTKILFDQSNGSLSGLTPAQSCQVTLAMQDSYNENALDSNGQLVKSVIQFAPPFLATWGRAQLDNQCRVTFETSFAAASTGFGSSSFQFSQLVGAPQQHTNPETANGLLSGSVDPNSGGGVVEARWAVVGSNPSFTQTLTKTVTVLDSPAVNGVPAKPISMPGLQVEPELDQSGLRATGCALADCEGRAGSIAAGLYHSCAISGDGKLFCWGDNNYGELGRGNIQAPSSNSPEEVSLPANHVARAVSVSGYNAFDSAHSCAILEESVSGQLEHRGVFCWGENQSGQLGRGTLTIPRAASQGVPQGVVGLSGSTGSEVYSVATGGAHTCAILKPTSEFNGGAVRCWGANARGQLGDGTQQNSPQPTTTIGFSAAGAQGIALGAEHSCVVTNVGTVQCWGQNDVFQLGVQYGPNGEKFKTQPVTVPNLTGVVGVAAGDKHTCALLNNGHVKCWGSNSSGQLGDGNSGGYTDIPSPVTGSVITTGEKAVAISAGGNATCALLENGGVKCWGFNTQGQLGDGSNLNSSRPSDVLDLANQALAVEVGTGHTCVLKNTGGVSCFGSLTATGLSVPQKKPVNNTMPQTLLDPPVPAAQYRNCRVLRSIDL